MGIKNGAVLPALFQHVSYVQDPGTAFSPQNQDQMESARWLRGLKLWLSKLEDLGQIPGTQNLKVRKTSAILTLLLEIENGNGRIAQKPWAI